MSSDFSRARAVADAVLFEGHALYPYRPTSAKNHLRWQFGVATPRPWAEATRSDPWWLETTVLVEPGAAGRGRVRGQLRFLRVRRRSVFDAGGAAQAMLEVGGEVLTSWDEGEVVEMDLSVPLAADGVREMRIALAADAVEEQRHGARVVRARSAIEARLELAVDLVAAARPLARLRARVENLTPWAELDAPRDQALAGSLIATHLLLAVDGGSFLSAIDPPDWARAAAGEPHRDRAGGLHPVLAGDLGRRDLVLAAPIILEDHPQVAPESPNDLFDATEIDEILTRRTRTLSDEEKRLARATDPIVAALIDRVEALPPAALARLHGTYRRPEGGFVVGSRVRLRPGASRTDAQDLFLAGRIATVRRVMRDVDDRECLAVTVDDDPAAEVHAWHGRYHYFYEDEVEPVR